MPETALSLGKELREIIHQQNWQLLRDRLRELNPADVADLMGERAATFEAIGSKSDLNVKDDVIDLCERVIAHAKEDRNKGSYPE